MVSFPRGPRCTHPHLQKWALGITIFIIFRSQLYVLAPAPGLALGQAHGGWRATRYKTRSVSSTQWENQDPYVRSHLGQMTSCACLWGLGGSVAETHRKKAPGRWRWGLNPISKNGEHCEMVGRGGHWDGRQRGDRRLRAILHGALNPTWSGRQTYKGECETAGWQAHTGSELPRDPALAGASPSNPAPPWNRFLLGGIQDYHKCTQTWS